MRTFQEASEIMKMIHALTRTGPIERDYVLRDPLRRPLLSIMSNIAEGNAPATIRWADDLLRELYIEPDYQT
ncbi:MAG: four helix bundle protein [Candidatus Acidiferrales bacterium]